MLSEFNNRVEKKLNNLTLFYYVISNGIMNESIYMPVTIQSA
jgi:hypothetical protein